MTDAVDLDRFAVVLKQPHYPENIGSAARAMCNMGIRQLVLVDPQQCDLTRILKLATHAAFDVVENMTVHRSLKEALAPFNYVVGTTARLGGQRPVVRAPSKIAARLAALSRENRVALVFGPEDRGLTNEDIRLCHELVNIPTAAFASLNLAQAVMIVCYELYQASLQEVPAYSARLASRHELDGMYEQVRDILVRINYINPENPDYWMNRLRHFFTRLQLRAKEVSIIRGICRQIDWYAGKRYRDGLEEGKGEEQ
jgi:tRNA/rRNA methyltransferase